MTWKLLQGDVLDKLSEIETGTVQTCVTSPPYWGLRDYGVPGQLGLEPTPEEYVEKMVQVFREVRRVLRDDGTLWLNLGDSYAGNCSQASNNGRAGFGNPRERVVNRKGEGLKPKDLVGIPWMVAFALRADGWYLRQDIIWHKPNPMPESVKDRPTKAHEYIFLLSKNQKYFYDAEAVKEPLAESTLKDKRNSTGRHTQGKEYSKYYDDASPEKTKPDMPSWYRAKSFVNPATGRNRRSVWTISTQPYPEAHFATFPPKLIEPCILAGTSPRACEICGAPWERVIEKTNNPDLSHKGSRFDSGKTAGRDGGDRTQKGIRYLNQAAGWQPTCTCKNEGTGRCIVLDPFAGSGTTLWVAEHYGRDSIGIELSPEYCELINKRMSNRQMTLFERGADL